MRTISNNKIVNNENGIYTTYSSNNKIISNNISRNDLYGIYISSQSDFNMVQYNYISHNNFGLRVKGARSNIFNNNIVKNNQEKGFYFCCGSRNNVVFNNSIINNSLNADDHYNNQWYNIKYGNYWGDYEEKYPLSVDVNNDGFWDTPYLVYGDTNDLFPRIQPVNIASL